MKKRFIVVLCPSDPEKTNVAGRILKPLQDAKLQDVELVVVSRVKFGFKHDGVDVVEVDDETAAVDTRLKNFTIRKFYSEHGGADAGWLYMMSEELEVIDGPGFAKFFDDLERMLSVFDMNAWLNTHTDGMNHVFDRYNPRYTVVPDDGIMDRVLHSMSPVHWTSHANTELMALNLAYDKWEERFLFNESFSIPMFYIIDWICRQKEANEKIDGDSDLHWHWMNLYPAVDSEGGLFKLAEWDKLGLDKSTWKEPHYRDDPSPDDFKREQEIFDKYGHDFAFASNPDPVFRFMYKRFGIVAEKEGIDVPESAATVAEKEETKQKD